MVSASSKIHAGANTSGIEEVDEAASGSRRRAPDVRRAAAVRSAQVRSVGTAFLRVRPLIVFPVAVLNGAMLALSGAPAAQRAWVAGGLVTTLGLFAVEASYVRRRIVTERWLEASLWATSLLLALGCALSGGLGSPFVPLLFAPAVVGAAAFGRTPTTNVQLMLTFLTVVGLLFVPPLWPRIEAPYHSIMMAASFAAVLALAYAGVASLVDAHARTSEVLDRMRVATLEEAASRMRATEQVGAKVAHELKNPLAGIKALLQLVRGGADLAPKAGERLGVALAEVDRMDDIVRDYLAFARPLAELELGRVDPRALADDVAAVLAAQAELAGVTLEVRGETRLTRGDARRLREAVLNVADNAVAATPRGGSVTLTLAEDAVAVTIVVEDTGPGVAADFEPAPYATTKPGGTGLGLTIARAAVAQHGGTLELARRDPHGTRAIIRLPFELA